MIKTLLKEIFKTIGYGIYPFAVVFLFICFIGVNLALLVGPICLALDTLYSAGNLLWIPTIILQVFIWGIYIRLLVVLD